MPEVEQVVPKRTRTQRAKIVSVRLTQQERDEVWRIAETRGQDPSKMLRGMILGLLQSDTQVSLPPVPVPAAGASAAAEPMAGPIPTLSTPAVAPGRSWAAEWAAMEQMEPGEAAAHFQRLAKGAKVPPGFRTWQRAAKVAWLDKECPLNG